MAEKHLNNIFLSASIPDEKRNEIYFKTADVIAIRDSVRALATVVIPKSRLIWGGHPAITPLIRYVMERMEYNIRDHVTLYQSNFFRDLFPDDNFSFEDVKITAENKDRGSSLNDMRYEMIVKNEYKAGIFIGGMEGVEDEFKLFREAHAEALILPVSSTGAAAKIIYDSLELKPDKRLVNDYAYMTLFKHLLKDII
ncbi:MAG: hypothetical protein IT280_12455 [Ignavibacteria bacterium]|nr:hypothetical protein [Ignavibacteria bacterium]